MQSSCPEPLLTRLFLSVLSLRENAVTRRISSRRAGLRVGLKKMTLVVLLGAAAWWQEEEDALPSTWKRDGRGKITELCAVMSSMGRMTKECLCNVSSITEAN